MQEDHSTISKRINFSRGLEMSSGNELGCSKITIVDDCSCSGVNDISSTPDISRGSLYVNSVSGSPSRKVSEHSPLSDDKMKESLFNEETRHFIVNDISLSDPVHSTKECSSNHFPKITAMSSDCIDLLASFCPKESLAIQQVAERAEKKWRESIKDKTR